MTRRHGARLAALLVVAALVLAAAAVPAGATQGDPAPSFVVGVHDDGDADVTLTLTYDLATDDERIAFRTLQNDSDARADARDRFADRMASVASDASAATGREMAVRDPAIDLSLSEDGSVGVVALSVTWTNLAAVDDDRLVVTEPFASGFAPDRTFTVRGPDGYALASASPAPDDRGDGAATWEAGSNLSGFAVAFAPADDKTASGTTSEDTGIGAPGFGVGVAVAALAAAALVAARRR